VHGGLHHLVGPHHIGRVQRLPGRLGVRDRCQVHDRVGAGERRSAGVPVGDVQDGRHARLSVGQLQVLAPGEQGSDREANRVGSACHHHPAKDFCHETTLAAASWGLLHASAGRIPPRNARAEHDRG
jgi:hypothetical protein